MKGFENREESINTSLPHIQINIQGVSLRCLLDTGSEASYINENLINAMISRKIGTIRKTNKLIIVSATKKKIAVIDRIFLTEFRLGKCNVSGEFLIIKGLPRDGIIGLDLLRKINAVIDIEKELLCLKNGNIPWMENKVMEEIIINCIMMENEIDYNENKIEIDEVDDINNVEDVNRIEIDCPQEYLQFARDVFKKNILTIDKTPRCALKYEHKLEDQVACKIKEMSPTNWCQWMNVRRKGDIILLPYIPILILNNSKQFYIPELMRFLISCYCRLPTLEWTMEALEMGKKYRRATQHQKCPSPKNEWVCKRGAGVS